MAVFKQATSSIRTLSCTCRSSITPRTVSQAAPRYLHTSIQHKADGDQQQPKKTTSGTKQSANPGAGEVDSQGDSTLSTGEKKGDPSASKSSGNAHEKAAKAGPSKTPNVDTAKELISAQVTSSIQGTRKMTAKERDAMFLQRMKDKMGQEAWEDGQPRDSGLSRNVKNNMFRLI